MFFNFELVTRKVTFLIFQLQVSKQKQFNYQVSNFKLIFYHLTSS